MFSEIDSKNSSTVPLGVGGTFTGPWVNVERFPGLTVSVKTDQEGYFYVDSSPDGENADSVITFVAKPGSNKVHRLTLTKAYYRVRFENISGVAQTYFRLQSKLGNFTLLTSNLNSTIRSDADAIIARTVESEIAIATGLFDGFSIVNKLGENPDVDSGTTPEDIWEGGGVYTGFPTSGAETLEVFSSSASDTAAGAGARTLRLIGLDADWNVQSETVTLNGTTPVTTVGTYRRCHTAAILTSGSATAFNVGTITIRHSTTTANVFQTMLPGKNQTNSSGYTVPLGYTAYMRKIVVTIRGGSNNSIDGSIWTRTNGGAPRLRRPFTVSTTAALNDIIYGGLAFPEKSDIILRVTATAGTNIDVAGGYDLILRENNI